MSLQVVKAISENLISFFAGVLFTFVQTKSSCPLHPKHKARQLTGIRFIQMLTQHELALLIPDESWAVLNLKNMALHGKKCSRLKSRTRTCTADHAPLPSPASGIIALWMFFKYLSLTCLLVDVFFVQER